MKSVLACFLSCLAFAGCANAPFVHLSARRPLEFHEIKELTPGTANRAQIQEKLGNPDKIEFLDSKQEAWLYYDSTFPKTARLALTMVSGTGVMKGAVWNVRPDDAEASLTEARKLLASEDSTVVWRPRWSPLNPKEQDEVYFEDVGNGVKILYRPSRKAVEMIVLSGRK